MSAHQPTTPTTDSRPADDAPPDIDAYAIEIPDEFVDAYPTADTVAEALRLAEQFDPGNDDGPTCVRCGGRRLSPKGNGPQGDKLTTGYVCETCGTHQSDPEHPALSDIEFADGQVQLGRFGDE